MRLMLFMSALPAAGAFAYDLGGPCAERESGLEYRALLERHAAAKKHGDLAGEIEAQKGIVRLACANSYRWYKLADLLLEAKKQGEVLDLLAEMEGRGLEIKAEGMPFKAALRQFITTQAFRDSEVGRRYERRLEAYQKTRSEFAARFRRILDGMTSSSRPPAEYVAKGACPFECCTFGSWVAREETELFDQPGGSKRVARIAKGSEVRALTGEVHVAPTPVGVAWDHASFKKDEIFFLLNYLGEDQYDVWHQGSIDVLDVSFIQECALHPSESCWADYLEPEPKDRSVWWVEIELPDGTKGWTKQTDHFDGKDTCA